MTKELHNECRLYTGRGRQDEAEEEALQPLHADRIKMHGGSGRELMKVEPSSAQLDRLYLR
jgi:hypothetical protein